MTGIEALNEADVHAMSIAPGSAPEAGIYALKVFGDTANSTQLIVPALDWVGEQITNGERIDIVSMSLGGAANPPDTADAKAVDVLTEQGVLSVIAAGNEGDIVNITGSPSGANSALTVAASQSGRALMDGIRVNTPDSLSGELLTGAYSMNMTQDFNVTGEVVAISPDNVGGCSAYSAEDKQAVAGNIAWVASWDDVNLPCSTTTVADNATDADAIAVMVVSRSNLPSRSSSGNDVIPMFKATASSHKIIQSALDEGTLNVTLSSDWKLSIPVDRADEFSDVIASFTSRGIHGSVGGIVKPDVAAPGVGIISASSATGNGAASMSGTSMATPLVSGVAALVIQAHEGEEGWTPARVKATIMNTADHDVTTEKDATADESSTVAYGPLRVGTGRIDARNAVASEATVFASNNEAAVTGGFGIVQVLQDGDQRTMQFTVSNTADTSVTYSMEYLPRVETPGVSYTLSASSVTVPANGTATFDVTLTAVRSEMRHTIDPTQDAVDSLTGFASNYVTDASGIVRLVPQTTADLSGDDVFFPLRVAVVAAPRPVSETSTSITVNSATEGTLSVIGRGLNQGEGSEAYTSQIIPMRLIAEDPQGDHYTNEISTQTLASGDIRAAGLVSTAPQLEDPSQGYLIVGVVTDQAWSRLGPAMYPLIYLDLNNDGELDYSVEVAYGQSVDGTPKYSTCSTVTLYRLDGGNAEIVDVQPLPDNMALDSNTMAIPISLSALGYTSESEDATMAMYLGTYAGQALRTETIEGEEYTVNYIDMANAVLFDAFDIGLWFGDGGQTDGGTWQWADDEGTQVPVHFADDSSDASAQNDEASDDTKLLILHTNGLTPISTEDDPILDIQTVTAPDPDPEPTPDPEPDPNPSPSGPDGSKPSADGGSQSKPLSVTGVAVGAIVIVAVLLVAAGIVVLVIRKHTPASR
ncbi:subtilisin family peptidase [Bifidobacterium lemurum]|uniref:Subtilisin family peptidase n=1 Tax=Bifidobacterium lemurum TaxID=1603886 RepID=A0A261FSX0_9BIFI|nr:S8 family serine peptidase [Bifidobacterium lemurum]OZG62075.1 subtilisin family peptidase [Bifidobacterium lemurum]QOL34902.1 S8 family serine peptidase [Bifidobacterium lemurum]